MVQNGLELFARQHLLLTTSLIIGTAHLQPRDLQLNGWGSNDFGDGKIVQRAFHQGLGAGVAAEAVATTKT
jgi:hypothetical protein